MDKKQDNGYVNHKGTFCAYKKEPLFCQEGYCYKCQVFLDYCNKSYGGKYES